MKSPYRELLKPLGGRKNHGDFRKTGTRLGIAAMVLGLTVAAVAQKAAPSPDTPEVNIDGYSVHQSSDLGGHIVGYSGSPSMWDTLVNLQSGPRILSFSLDMRSTDTKKTPFFDVLTTSNFGYGGDPLNTTILRMSKGKIYDFTGSFRRDRQYFDYDLLANPLIPDNAVPYAPLLNSPHLFNTVRRITDGGITIMPLSRVSYRLEYTFNVAEGPSYSTIHEGADPLLTQYWRNSTSTYRAGIDYKLFPKTILSYDQLYTYYKGDTTWQLTGLNYQLANGTPVSLGIDIFTTSANTCLVAGTVNTVKPNCNGALAYSRSLPTRTSFPTENFHFTSNSIERVTMNGRFVYSGDNGNADHYSEIFDGLTTRTAQRGTVDFGNGPDGQLAKTKRVNVNADYGITVEVTPKILITDVFDFWNWHISGQNDYTENSVFGATLASVPNVFNPATCPPPYTAATCPQHTSSSGPDTLTQQNYTTLTQDTKSNLVSVSWDATPRLKATLGYRYRTRNITDSILTNNFEYYTPKLTQRGDCAAVSGHPNPNCTFAADGTATTNTQPEDGTPDVTLIHEQGGLFGLSFQPTSNLRLNFNMDATYADASFTRISPRQTQHYVGRGLYKPKPWMTFSGAINIFQSRNNVDTVNYLHHANDYSFGVVVAKPDARWGLDMNYSYSDVYSSILECYVSTPPPSGSSPCTFAPGYLESTVLYNQPTNFGSIGIILNPVKRVHTNFGYRMSAVNGNETLLNPRQVPGSLQSQWQQPYFNLAIDIAPQWTWKGNYNYYSYGEGTPIGPTLPRSFRGNVVTLAVNYSF
jgi:hypothetical protein